MQPIYDVLATGLILHRRLEELTREIETLKNSHPQYDEPSPDYPKSQAKIATPTTQELDGITLSGEIVSALVNQYATVEISEVAIA